jgi:hypothetical protein
MEDLEGRLKAFDKPVVLKEDIFRLEEFEQEEAARQGLEEYKYASNDEMLGVMGLVKAGRSA